MISANELRLGNWISGQNDPPMTVMSIDKHGIEAYFFESEADNWYYEMHDVKGIPITPEILSKAGFTFSTGKAHFTDGYYYFDFAFDDNRRLVYLSPNTDIRIAHYCDYVHELQNLYFVLIRQELQFKVNPA